MGVRAAARLDSSGRAATVSRNHEPETAMPRYCLDPRWITARFASNCPQCRKPIRKGSRVFYYPNGKKALCETCGTPAAAKFEADCHDEAFLRRDVY